jgi:beta-mannosidase
MLCSQVTRSLHWEVLHPIKNQWFAFGENGSVQQWLFQTGALPDPFYGKNEHLYDWVEEHDWRFKTTFYLSEQEFNAKDLQLVFPNIDTYGTVYLNQKMIGKTDNFHRTWQFPIQSTLQCGYNELEVVIVPPVRYHKERFEKEDFHYPAPNDPHVVKSAPLSRKPQYQFGWDWALRMNTIGFSKTAFLEIKPRHMIHHVNVNTLNFSSDVAELSMVFELDTDNQSLAVVQSKRFGSLPFKRGLNVVSIKEMSPKLWWPIGFGSPHLYQDTIQLFDIQGRLVQEKVYQFGIRTTELIQEKDKWGTSYVVKVNGMPIFCKGANYIPPTVFPNQVTPENLEKIVQQMKAAHFNMVRIWGGGMYADDYLLKRCDEEGIMVWHDLMFACAMYPGDESFLGTVKIELEQHIPRITAHPSVVLINGNNEVDVAWKNWGFQQQYKLNAEHQKIIEADYVALFKKLAPQVISGYTNTPYVHTSPLSNWGNEDFYNHGSQHYWGVWHGKDPMEDFARKIGRFNAEYGFQSFPEFSTLMNFSAEADWSLKSEVMKHHQKSYVGNGMIEKHAILLYGKPNTFEDFVYYSQLTQAHAVSSAVSGHRLDAPRCSGTIFWQLNDCWPAPTWSSVDFNGNWKALHYAVQKDFEPVAILSTLDKNGKTVLHLKNDLPETIDRNVRIRLFDLKGKLLSEEVLKLTLSYQQSLVIWEARNAKWNNGILVEVSVDNQLDRNFLVADKKALSGRKPVVVIQEITFNEVDRTGKVTFHTSEFCADFWLFSLFQGIHFEKNFQHLLPGSHTISFRYGDKPNPEDFKFLFR